MLSCTPAPHPTAIPPPNSSHKDAIVTAVQFHEVAVLRGETGCGKSSRVPQFLLDSDPNAKIVVAQPRRLAAITLAKRVASERGEPLGKTVGYRIGQASKASKDTRLTFVTVGYLLQRLVHHHTPSTGRVGGGDGGRAKSSSPFNYTHVVIDEVHERDLDTDLLCLIVRIMLQRHRDYTNKLMAGGKDLDRDERPPPPFKLVCMSATFDAQEFFKYFRAVTPSVAPPLIVDGQRRTYPVDEVYLEDIPEAMPSLGRGSREYEWIQRQLQHFR